MRCPKCGATSRPVQVLRRVDGDGWDFIKRKHKCTNGHLFETYQSYEYADVEVFFKARAARLLLEAGDGLGALQELRQLEICGTP